MTEKRRRFKRWVEISTRDVFGPTLRKCRELGVGITGGGKPAMGMWYGLAMLATAPQVRELEFWWGREGFRWFPRRPRGAQPVNGGGDVIPWGAIMAKLKRRP